MTFPIRKKEGVRGNVVPPGDDGVIISNLLEQPYIFEYDYAKMKLKMDILREELIQKAMHPSRVCKLIEEGYDEML